MSSPRPLPSVLAAPPTQRHRPVIGTKPRQRAAGWRGRSAEWRAINAAVLALDRRQLLTRPAAAPPRLQDGGGGGRAVGGAKAEGAAAWRHRHGRQCQCSRSGGAGAAQLAATAATARRCRCRRAVFSPPAHRLAMGCTSQDGGSRSSASTPSLSSLSQQSSLSLDWQVGSAGGLNGSVVLGAAAAMPHCVRLVRAGHRHAGTPSKHRGEHLTTLHTLTPCSPHRHPTPSTTPEPSTPASCWRRARMWVLGGHCMACTEGRQLGV